MLFWGDKWGWMYVGLNPRRWGHPRSWRHYVLGLQHLARHRARMNIRWAQAVRTGMATKESAAPWFTEQEREAEWD